GQPRAPLGGPQFDPRVAQMQRQPLSLQDNGVRAMTADEKNAIVGVAIKYGAVSWQDKEGQPRPPFISVRPATTADRALVRFRNSFHGRPLLGPNGNFATFDTNAKHDLIVIDRAQRDAQGQLTGKADSILLQLPVSPANSSGRNLISGLAAAAGI